MKIPKNLFKSRKFLIGFEVEMIFDANKISPNKLKEALTKIHNRITWENDGSIDPDGRMDDNYDYDDENYDDYADEKTLEIQTPPLYPHQSFNVLKEVFALVKKYGYTNETCGFHLNISPTNEKLYKSLNPFKFTLNNLWEKIKEDFGRLDNDYCNSVFPELDSPDLQKLFLTLVRSEGNMNVFHWKDADVNFEHYDNRNKAARRIEIRAFGGEGYHKKMGLIRGYAEKIMKTFIKSCA